jgi:putative ABC transport system permease protein
VGDTKHYALDSATTEQVYVPFQQATADSMTLVLRSDVDPASLAAAVRKEVLAVDPDQPVSDLKTLEQAVSGSVARQRFAAALLGFFASLALVLAAAGIYAVTAYSVGQRTQEMGLRMALGANSKDILRLVLKRGLALTAVGLATGLLGAVALTRLLTALLYETSPLDVGTFLCTSVIIVGASLVACYVPARRATKVDPMVALRCE